MHVGLEPVTISGIQRVVIDDVLNVADGFIQLAFIELVPIHVAIDIRQVIERLVNPLLIVTVLTGMVCNLMEIRLNALQQVTSGRVFVLCVRQSPGEHNRS